MKATSYDELANLTSLAKTSIQAKAVRLRKAGVKLPLYGRGKKVIDVKELNALITRLTKK